MGPLRLRSSSRLGCWLAARDLARRILGRGAQLRSPILSFGSWDRFPTDQPKVVQVCHPDWRGVRTATYAFRSPVVECDDLTTWSDQLIEGITGESIDLVIIQGWPPGAAGFAARLADMGIRVKAVLHSSPAQHGAEMGEADVADEVLSLFSHKVLAEVGMVKYGVAEAFRAGGHPVTYLPNRAPLMPEVAKVDLGPGLHVGVFAEPFWRKNVVTQLLAVGMLDGAQGHLMSKPSVGYLNAIDVVEHGVLPWEEFVGIQGSVDLNLYVTLTECHPVMPIESYLLGVPCLTSRTSAVFRNDPELWELTTVDKPDEPKAIAEQARLLLESEEEAVSRARAWILNADVEAQELWLDFVTPV